MSGANELFESYKNVKIGCHDCKGCSDCCRGMGNSIILDPFDFYELETGLQCTPQELLWGQVELNVHEGLILPNLKMAGEEEQCMFLNAQGRCGIHGFRPGLCRLFPLGRNYEDGKLSYFILQDACQSTKDKTKVKIIHWIDITPMEKYERFLTDWHYFLKDVREKNAALPQTQWESGVKNTSMNILQNFYLNPYDLNRNFYEQFYERMKL